MDRTRPHLRDVGRRRAHPSFLHPRTQLGGSGYRGRRPLQIGVRARDAGHPDSRELEGDPTLLRGAVAADPASRPTGRWRPSGRRCPVDLRRRAYLRLYRRSSGPGMEHDGGVGPQTGALRRLAAPPEAPVRPGRSAPPWAGEVVSGRAAPPMGALGILAQRRRTHLAGRIAHRRRIKRLRPRRDRSPGAHRRPRPTPGRGRGPHPTGFRGSFLPQLARTPTPEQRHRRGLAPEERP